MQDDLKLSNQLCFPIYALSRQITNIYRPHLDKLGLTYPQYLVLMILWEQESVTIKHLGELLWLDSGTLTPLLKRMESNGILQRKRSLDDERVVNITITEKGKSIETKASLIPCAVKEALKTSDEQVGQLREQLKSLLDITSEYNNK